MSAPHYGIWALDASTGAILWSYATGDTSYSSPAVANGVVYVGSYGSVYAFHAPSNCQINEKIAGLTVREGRALPDFNDVSVRIADVAADLRRTWGWAG